MKEVNMGKKLIVFHTYYGCETGCCGHSIRFEDEDEYDRAVGRRFGFSHPYGPEDKLQWAKEFVASELGPEHVADLDWDQCMIVDFSEE